ncbi:MAG: DUF763 domain-containing protein [Candidatus Nanoarchaeia archaeon]
MQTGFADLPLHYGTCPKWLFEKMVRLGQAISELIIEEFSENEFLRRLSDPFFFQAFGCVLGFDWHSSGLTTTVCGALKEALNNLNLGVYIAGGKGSTSKKTPEDILKFGEKLNLSPEKINELIKASKLSAKVDSALVQDNYNLYHHVFIFTKDNWAVIQQGMNSYNRYARRYHWLSENVKQFTETPHLAICAQNIEKKVLNLTAKESRETKSCSLDLINDQEAPKQINKILTMPKYHHLKNEFNINCETLQRAAEIQPANYEELLMIRGFGPKHVRALALISNLIYGSEISWKDPANYSFAHGGKDGTPFPVDEKLYENSIITLQEAINNAKINSKEKLLALKRLGENYNL